MSLNTELAKLRPSVRSNAYSMSIGELVSLYSSGELVIDPVFQRHFRWKRPQKIRFIESILLEFPLPAIFVVTNSDGTWSLLDGLQRFATILEFMGILQDEDDPSKIKAPLTLSGTEMLPELEGVVFGGEDDESGKALSGRLRIDFRRQKIDVKIILPETNTEMILELFTRLNGGSAMTQQEVRNAVINKRELNFWKWLEGLAKYPHFTQCLLLSDRDIEESYNVELALRLIARLHLTQKSGEDAESFLDRIVRQRELYELDRDELERTFKEYFEMLASIASIGDDPFQSKERGFSVEAFDLLAIPQMRKGPPFDKDELAKEFEAYHETLRQK